MPGAPREHFRLTGGSLPAVEPARGSWLGVGVGVWSDSGAEEPVQPAVHDLGHLLAPAQPQSAHHHRHTS